jgi:hypothetical protein
MTQMHAQKKIAIDYIELSDTYSSVVVCTLNEGNTETFLAFHVHELLDIYIHFLNRLLGHVRCLWARKIYGEKYV